MQEVRGSNPRSSTAGQRVSAWPRVRRLPLVEGQFEGQGRRSRRRVRLSIMIVGGTPDTIVIA
jgi:hypothetical protein